MASFGWPNLVSALGTFGLAHRLKDVRRWPIASFCCPAEFYRDRGIADIVGVGYAFRLCSSCCDGQVGCNSCPINLSDLPDGQISQLSVCRLSRSRAKNFPLSPTGKSSLPTRPVPPRHEGRLAIVTDAGRDAMDAGCRKTSGADPPSLKLRRDWYQARRVVFVETAADGEVVWA
jgi:hypothetical protein